MSAGSRVLSTCHSTRRGAGRTSAWLAKMWWPRTHAGRQWAHLQAVKRWAGCKSQHTNWACAAAVRGPYAASYLSPYARIAPHMAALGFDRYVVNAVALERQPRCSVDAFSMLASVVCASRLAIQPQHDHGVQVRRTTAVSSVSHRVRR